MRAEETKRFMAVLGQPGLYSWMILTLLCLNYFPVTFNHLAMSIYGAVPPHRCRLPDRVTADNGSIPGTGGGKLDPCHVYTNYTYMSGQEVGCTDGWVYTLLEGDSTVVNEWDLVCDNKYLSSLSTTIYFTGVMVGGLVCGPIADITGRRPMMIVTMYLPVLLGTMVYLVQSVPLFMLLRFCIGVMMQGIQLVTYVLLSELCTTSKTRAYGNAMFECCWSFGAMTLAAIAYIFRDWRSMQLAITLPTLFTLMWVWALPESLRWMLHRRRYNDSIKYLKRAARVNKLTITPEVERELREFCLFERREEAGARTCSIWDAFKTPNLRKHTLIMFYIWLATSVTYIGLALQAFRLTGGKYLNFFISGAVDLPPNAAAFWILSILGRTNPLCVYFLTGGVSCILSAVVSTVTGDGSDMSWVSTMLAWLGKLSMAGCWSVLFLYTSEVFPTAIRTAGVGACAMCARLGGVIAPQINLLGEYSKSWLPIVIFGSMAILAGLLTFLLPETRDLPFPDTLEEAENLGKRSKSRDKKGSTNEAYNDQKKHVSRDPEHIAVVFENKDFTRM